MICYRTEIQTYKVEERTFGTSCKRSSTLIFRLRMIVLNTPKNPYLNQGKILATFSWPQESWNVKLKGQKYPLILPITLTLEYPMG